MAVVQSQHVLSDVRPVADDGLQHVAVQIVRDRAAPNRVQADAQRALRCLTLPDRLTRLRTAILRARLTDLAGLCEPVNVMPEPTP